MSEHKNIEFQRGLKKAEYKKGFALLRKASSLFLFGKKKKCAVPQFSLSLSKKEIKILFKKFFISFFLIIYIL